MAVGDFTSGNLRKQILSIALPMSVGMFFNTMFNVADTYFAGQLGTAPLAGMSVSFSVFFIMLALSSGMGSGISALIAIAQGSKRQDEVEALTYSGIRLATQVGIGTVVFGFFLTPVLLMALGATGSALSYGTDYLRTLYFGAPFYLLNAAFGGILSSRGMTKPNRNFLVTGFFANLILDPLFIFGWFGLPEMGTAGVALATVLVQAGGTVYLAQRCHKIFKVSIRLIIMERWTLYKQREILAQGIPATLNMLTTALGIFIINYFIYRHGDDASVAGYGVAIRIEQLVLLLTLGLNTATMTLVGQNFGAKNIERIRLIYRTTMGFGVMLMALGMVFVYVLAPVLVDAFNGNPDVVASGAGYLRIEFLALIGYAILNISIAFLQAIKRPKYAIWIGMFRQLILPLVLFTLLGEVLGFGIHGIWWGIVISVWVGVLIGLTFVRFEMKQLERRLELI